MTETVPPTDARVRLLDAALPHVVFDGWSDATFQAAVRDTGIDPALARVACPRRATDLAVLYHRRADAEMAARISSGLPEGMRFRDRVAHALWLRLSLVDREIVRRGVALFSLPQHAATGSRLVWDTADAVWRALGDTSEDINWYTKRATLAAVWSATVLYWLGDESEGQQSTRDFIDRRIEDVMRIEKAKARVRQMPLVGRMLEGLAGMVHAPGEAPADLAGRTGR